MSHPVDRGKPPTPAFPTAPRPPQVSAFVAEQILERIVSGALPLGARLPSETELASDFGVSRPSVREALAALQFAGHVESRRGYGTVVVSRESPAGDAAGPPARRAPLAALSQAVDLLETRLLVEPHAMAVAATDPDPAALRAARGLINGMRVAVGDAALHSTSDIRVHRALLQVCRNAILRESANELLDLALDPMLSTARIHAWASPDLPQVWADQHDLVCAAIEAADPDAARAACLEHLASVVDNLTAAVTHDPALERRIVAMTARFGIPALKSTPAEARSTETEAVDDRSR